MNKRGWTIALLGLGLFGGTCGISAAATFAGTWTISATLGNPVVETTAPTCVFEQEGSKLSGRCKGPSASGPAAGVVSGSAVEWQWHKIPTNHLQVNSIATYRGTFSGSTVRGTWTDSYDRGLVGPFTGQRSK